MTAVQVVLINPGYVNTPMVDKVAGNAKRERMLQPDDIAEVCHSCSWLAPNWTGCFMHHATGLLLFGLRAS